LRSEASLESLLARLGHFIADRPAPILFLFAGLLLVGGFYGATAAQHLPAGGFEVPGSESDQAVKEAERRFGTGSADILALYRVPGADLREAQVGAPILDLRDTVVEQVGVVGATSY
jgi:RND superfamily putative drug exporter